MRRRCEVAGLFADHASHGLGDGVVHLRGAIAPDVQSAIAAQCLELIDGAVPAYVPVVRGGGHMHVRMLCLGRHWNGTTYRYEPTRTDYDGRPVPSMPESLIRLARGLARQAGMSIEPDICIVNHYGPDGKMGLHQDKDESAASIAAGIPIVSISLGDSGGFLLGGTRRRDPVVPVRLESGDVIVFGGAGRLRYHGLSRIYSGTSPAWLPLQGRLNLTFRQY